MTVDQYMEKPSERSHAAFADSLFSPTAAEYSTSEVLLGGVYRKLITGTPENDVDLETIPEIVRSIPAARGDARLWRNILLELGGIASPARSGQRRSKPIPQLMPIISEAARYGCVLGRKGKNRWTPGNLLLEIIGSGVGIEDGKTHARRLGENLIVGSGDDLLARFLEDSLRDASAGDGQHPRPFESPDLIREEHCRGLRSRTGDLTPGNPAEQFCADLGAIMELKNALTRRQWTVLVEAVLRIGFAMHWLWICWMNAEVWRQLQIVIEGGPVPSPDTLTSELWSARRGSAILEVGRDAVPSIKLLIEQYVHGRFGINLVLHRLDEVGAAWPGTAIGFSAVSNTYAPQCIHEFLVFASNQRLNIDAHDPKGWILQRCATIVDGRPGLARCESGFSKNLLEFIRHSLGQIETQDPERRSYDQSYLLANKSRRTTRRSRWPVELGPAMLIALAHCCCRGKAPLEASLEDLREHLAKYRVDVPAHELSGGSFSDSLQRLGLVVDSPDAAGGRLIVSPFRRSLS
ncbi:MAG: hypothetical protein IT427_01530 [Pirellulales bacterium]|nr:hypothetical protein [Pirellulales bacterium]